MTEKIINNINEVLDLPFKLDSKTLYNLFDKNFKQISEIEEIDIEIFKTNIGIYTNGEIQSYKSIAQKFQISKNVVVTSKAKFCYLIYYYMLTQKSNLDKEILKQTEIKKIFPRKIVELLNERNIITVKDLLERPIIIEDVCKNQGIMYDYIREILITLGLNISKTETHSILILELNTTLINKLLLNNINTIEALTNQIEKLELNKKEIEKIKQALLKYEDTNENRQKCFIKIMQRQTHKI